MYLHPPLAYPTCCRPWGTPTPRTQTRLQAKPSQTTSQEVELGPHLFVWGLCAVPHQKTFQYPTKAKTFEAAGRSRSGGLEFHHRESPRIGLGCWPSLPILWTELCRNLFHNSGGQWQNQVSLQLLKSTGGGLEARIQGRAITCV